MHPEVLTIVGVGLIGGSIALAAKERRLAQRIRGVGRNRDHLQWAQSQGIIDEYSLDLKTAFRGSSLVFFCTPVDKIIDQLAEAAPYLDEGAIVTDAGSVKEGIVEAGEKACPVGVHFVGGHPLAGSEKRGADHADAQLFAGRWTVLTPTPHTDVEALKKLSEFWQDLGALVATLAPLEHDRALALTSHLPHVVASALAGILPDGIHHLAATGFRDTTRIASGDAPLWSAILEQNRHHLLESLSHFEARVREFRQALETLDRPALEKLLSQGKKVRDALGS